jgi:hypothetical protein
MEEGDVIGLLRALGEAVEVDMEDIKATGQ